MPRMILLLLLALCAGPIAAEEEPSDTYHTLRIGDPLPAVDFILADGRRVDRDEFRGRIVVIDFWATWCAPCIASFPRLNELERQFAGRPIDFYSVTYETPAMIRPVLEDNPLETEIGFDNDFATFKSFRAWGIPATYIIGPEGRVMSALHPDHLTAEVLETVLRGEIPDVEQSRGWPDPEGAEEHFRSLLD